MIILLGLVSIVGCSLPSMLDVRVQPSIGKYGDYSVGFEGVCEGYGWAQQLAQVVSNAISIAKKEKIQLSGQNIIECISSETDLCKDVTMSNIQAGMNYVNKTGITTNYCYLNHYLEYPGTVCKRTCHDGTPYPLKIKAEFVENQMEEVLRIVGDGKGSGFVVIRLYDNFNYYSSEHPERMKAEGEVYGYGIVEIVGWRKQGKEVTVRHVGNGWGYKGTGYIDTSDKDIIVRAYSVKITQFPPSLQES